jgi:hypothetical protein
VGVWREEDQRQSTGRDASAAAARWVASWRSLVRLWHLSHERSPFVCVGLPVLFAELRRACVPKPSMSRCLCYLELEDLQLDLQSANL